MSLRWLSFGCPPRKGCRQILWQLWCHREWDSFIKGLSYSLEIVLSACTSHRLLVALAKRALWGNLLRSHQSDYILGAGAIPAEHAALSLHLSGLMFGATYTIYDIIDVFPERHKLIKLRNPAGHRDIFRGHGRTHHSLDKTPAQQVISRLRAPYILDVI